MVNVTVLCYGRRENGTYVVCVVLWVHNCNVIVVHWFFEILSSLEMA